MGILATYLVFKEIWKDSQYQSLKSHPDIDEDFFRLEEAQRNLQRPVGAKSNQQNDSTIISSTQSYQMKLNAKVSRLDTTLPSPKF